MFRGRIKTIYGETTGRPSFVSELGAARSLERYLESALRPSRLDNVFFFNRLRFVSKSTIKELVQDIPYCESETHMSCSMIQASRR